MSSVESDDEFSSFFVTDVALLAADSILAGDESLSDEVVFARVDFVEFLSISAVAELPAEPPDWLALFADSEAICGSDVVPLPPMMRAK